MTLPNSAIAAVSAVRPVLSWHADTAMPPRQVGELLRLLVEQDAQGQLLGQHGSGLLMRLPPGTAMPGDQLLLQVLSTQPKLELALIEHRPQRPAGESAVAEGELAALRSDQAWQLQLRLPSALSPAALAMQWRSRVLADASRLGLPSPVVAEPAQPQGLQPPPTQVLGWNAQALLLRLIQAPPQGWLLPDGGDEVGEPADAGDGVLALTVHLSFQGGWVQLLLKWQQGLWLQLSAEKLPTLQSLRALMPRIAAALAGVPLALRHCQLSSRLIAVDAPRAGTQTLHGAQGSSGPLFRAAAEIVWVLQHADAPSGSA
ncbi:hypothetical protein [Paucibacter sp. M5-1]|uniref:hypothetical protein n=1 Tax=Paucibacter sp. M5-1 TaxID=3015998 RepID=UPI0022B8F026|nr:hypothetical protein [Paucibacter sp. M5-1]MCZ7884646.1 hypothetical protein [Paucibacter sp. M5-1]